jgi:hypothetical protein
MGRTGVTMSDVMRERRRQALAESWELRHQIVRTVAMFPLDSLADLVPDRRLSVRNLAALCKVTRHRAHRWIAAGCLAVYDADRAACAAGHHPAELWADWYQQLALFEEAQ